MCVCFLCLFACVCVRMYGQLLVLHIQPCCSCSCILCYIMFHCNIEIAEANKMMMMMMMTDNSQCCWKGRRRVRPEWTRSARRSPVSDPTRRQRSLWHEHGIPHGYSPPSPVSSSSSASNSTLNVSDSCFSLLRYNVLGPKHATAAIMLRWIKNLLKQISTPLFQHVWFGDDFYIFNTLFYSRLVCFRWWITL